MRRSLLRMLSIIAAVAVVGMLFQVAGCRDGDDKQTKGEVETEMVEGQKLADRTVAVLVADKFEDSELVDPVDALETEGARIVFVASAAGVTYTGKHGTEVVADVSADSANYADFDALIIPGGSAPKELRENPAVVNLTRQMVQADKVVAAICHGPQVLVTAGVLSGRKATCYKSVADELEKAGADYRDESVIVDGNLITSRHPGDLPDFNEAIIVALAAQ
ncbi:MAG: type 1 glutamine amidotransferase domain-containing protein [Armatimonadota bacterium]